MQHLGAQKKISEELSGLCATMQIKAVLQALLTRQRPICFDQSGASHMTCSVGEKGGAAADLVQISSLRPSLTRSGDASKLREEGRK